jgi:hypothetical protein
MAETGTLDAFCGIASYSITQPSSTSSAPVESPSSYTLEEPPKTTTGLPQASPSCIPNPTQLTYQNAFLGINKFCSQACQEQWTYAKLTSIHDDMVGSLSGPDNQGEYNETGALKNGGWAGESFPSTQQGKEVLGVSVLVSPDFCPPGEIVAVWFGQKSPFLMDDCLDNYLQIVRACR